MPLGQQPDGTYPVVITVVDAVSLLSCAWLLCALRRLPAAQRQRLFPRQVMVLAASDVCLVIAGSDIFLEPFKISNTVWGLARCWSYNATLLAEFHIVLGFAAQIFGAQEASRRLSRCAWLPWLLAAVIAGIEHALFLWWGLASSCIACFCFLVSLIIFAAVLCRARASNAAVARRSLRRAAGYTANFLITFAPLVCATFLNNSGRLSGDGVFFDVALALYRLNGFVNVVTYFAQSRYSRSALPTHRDEHEPQSLVVRFQDDQEPRAKASAAQGPDLIHGSWRVEDLDAFLSELAGGESGGKCSGK